MGLKKLLYSLGVLVVLAGGFLAAVLNDSNEIAQKILGLALTAGILILMIYLFSGSGGPPDLDKFDPGG